VPDFNAQLLRLAHGTFLLLDSKSRPPISEFYGYHCIISPGVKVRGFVLSMYKGIFLRMVDPN